MQMALMPQTKTFEFSCFGKKNVNVKNATPLFRCAGYPFYTDIDPGSVTANRFSKAEQNDPHSVFGPFTQNGEVEKRRNIPALNRLCKKGLNIRGYWVQSWRAGIEHSLEIPCFQCGN